MKFTLYDIWNISLDKDIEKPLAPRDHIYASELGGAYCDRYLKMTGMPYSNPANARSRRKFLAGSIWENIVKYVLSRAGILYEAQGQCNIDFNGLLSVHGRLDLLAGGKPDMDKAKRLVETEFNWLPEQFARATVDIVAALNEKYPDGLDDTILEVKSCSSFMFEVYEAKQAASNHHKLQTYHYLKALNLPEGHICYICRDDARLIEIGVMQPSVVEDEYMTDIKTMTGYYLAKEVPPKEKPIIVEYDKFKPNWKVMYSSYLTYLYGFENQFAFEIQYRPLCERWNRVLSRQEENKKMTQNNLDAIDEMYQMGFWAKDGKALLS